MFSKNIDKRTRDLLELTHTLNLQKEANIMCTLGDLDKI